MNYQILKQLAADTAGLRVADLIALAPANDPFYVGSPGELAKGRWFADLWNRFGYSRIVSPAERRGVHLRRVHYQLASQDPPVTKPTGEPYQNTTNDWAYLLQAAKAARYLNLADPEAFVDRRNPDPRVYRSYYDLDEPGYQLDTWRGADIQVPEWPALPDFTVTGFEVEQPYHLEIWVEKTTMNDVLEPLCSRYQVNLITGAGELSITADLTPIAADPLNPH
jgi:hypothetical protein